MKPEKIQAIAAEYYVDLDPLQKVGELKAVESEIAGQQEVVAREMAKLAMLGEHRLALVFCIEAANQSRIDDPEPAA